MDVEEELHWLILSQLSGATPAIRRCLQQLSNNPREILHADDKLWRNAGAGPDLLRARRSWSNTGSRHKAERAAAAELAQLRKNQAFLIPLGSPAYPPLLAEIYDPPPLLYAAGDPEALARPQFAIVGSRRCASAGRRAAGEFASALVGSGYSICSGLALGIDAAAHRAALEAGGVTVAVMATGIDCCYPRRHAPLAEAIRSSGLLLTEFAPGTSPRPERFPMRNRLISGLSVGVLVAEANLRSGSLITARLALEQGREVFALPHSIYYPGGRGCNELIRQGAGLAEGIADILPELGPLTSIAQGRQTVSPVPAHLQQVYASLAYEPVAVDELVLLGLGDAGAVLSALQELQMQGLVENRSGLYMRKCDNISPASPPP
ncbi:MAG: DNA-processing protein DprA [Halieaceae bacterium]